MNTHASSIEALEARIAPAALSITQVEPSGDKVKFTVTKGDLTGHILVSPARDGVHTIYTVDISAPSFDGTNLNVTVTKAGGDGRAIIGRVNAGTNNLGTLKIGRDLVGGSGFWSGAVWARNGALDHLVIKGSVFGTVNLFASPSSLGGYIDVDISTDHRSISIGGDVVGGFIGSHANIEKITIGGSLIGRSGNSSGGIQLFDSKTVGPLKIGRDVIGGSGVDSAHVIGNVAKLIIGGAIIPGPGTNSGKIS